MSDPFQRLAANPLRFEDDRGWLEVLHETETAVLKRSFSKKGVFRGMHWQPGPNRQTKLIRVIEGRIIDFVSDVGACPVQVHHTELGPEDGWVRIDAGLAHGFYALSDTMFEYFCEGRYDEAGERTFSILPRLAEMGIPSPLLSAKDRAALPLEGAPA